MELHQSARVLPSNAPALPEVASDFLSTPTDLTGTLSSDSCHNYHRGHDCSACNCKQDCRPAANSKFGVLCVSSGNVGSSGYQSQNVDVKADSSQKYEFRSVSSLVNPPHHSAQAAIKAEHSRRQLQISWSFPSGVPLYWHCEWQSPKYRAYREKCRARGPNVGVWPDRLEEAFQIGIRIYRRRGRTKKDLHGKLSGGNEFIADYIFKTTGVCYLRKKVSSHLQVERNFMKDNKPWLSLVANIEVEKSRKKGRGNTTHEETADAYGDLEYENASDHRHSQASCRPLSKRPSAPIEVLATTACQGPTIRRVLEFTMAAVEKDHGQALRHTYTSIQSETASAPKPLADVKNWREMYPPLATYYDQRQIDCPVFLFDTRLSLWDHNAGEHALGIMLSVDFSQGARFTEWRSYPTFYEHSGCPVDLTYVHPKSKPWNSLGNSPIEGTDDSTVGQIVFGSKWWVEVFAGLVNKKIMAAASGDPRVIKEEEERAIQYVQGISVMQVIWARHRDYNRQPQRMAMLLWKFDTVRRGEAATTSWRRLIPPLSPYEIQSPHPPPETPPLTLDTTFQTASPYNTHYVSRHGIFPEHAINDSPTAPLPEDSLPPATPTPESRSFPSSTSASFPSSVSNSIYPLCPSQESSFQSQSSAYPALASFDSHDSEYLVYEHHESVGTAHDSYRSRGFVDDSHDSGVLPEVFCHSQDPLHPEHGPDQPLYEYPYPIDDAPATASTSHDFTSGQIHLSYAPPEDLQSSYDAALLATQADMVPRHELFERPEHFDQHDYLDPNPGNLGGGQDEVDDEQGHAQSLPQQYEMNGLAIDESTWEEMLRLNPDLERHLGIDGADVAERIGRQYVGSGRPESSESIQEHVVGEVEDGEGTPDRRLEYRSNGRSPFKLKI